MMIEKEQNVLLEEEQVQDKKKSSKNTSKNSEKQKQATTKKKTSSATKTAQAKTKSTKQKEENKMTEENVIVENRQEDKKERSFEMLFSKKQDKKLSGEDDTPGKIDNLQKLREQIFAQKRLERELMEKEARKARELDQQITSKIPDYAKLQYVVDEGINYELEQEKARAEHFEQENKELLDKIHKLEENYQMLLHSKYDGVEIFDPNTHELSSRFLEILQRDLNANILDEFTNMQKELLEIRNIYQQKEQSDLILKKKIDEFQSIYNQKQEEVERLRGQISYLETSVPKLKDTIKQKTELDEIKKLLEAQIQESEKYLKQVKEYEQQIQELKALNIKQAEKEKNSIANLEKYILELNNTISKLQVENEQITKLQQENKELQMQLKELQQNITDVNEHENLTKEIHSLKQAIEKAQKELTKQKQANKKLEKDYSTAKASNDELTSLLTKKDEEYKTLEKKVSELTSQLNFLQAKLVQKDDEIKDLHRELADIELQFSDLKEVELEKLQLELNSKNQELEQLQIENEEYLEKNKELSLEITTLREQIMVNNDKLTQLEELSQEVEKLSQELANYETLQNEYNALQTQVKEYQEQVLQLDELNLEIEKLTNELNILDDVKSENNHLREKLKNYQETQKQLANLQIEQEKLLQDLKSKDEKLANLQELESKLQEELLQIKETKLEPLTAELKEKQEELTKVQEQLNASQELIERLENESLKNLEDEIEAKDQEIYYLKNEVSRLENHIQTLEEKLDSDESNRQKEIDKLSAENEELKDKLYVQDLEISDHNETIENQTQLLSSLQDRLADLEEENAELHQTLKEAQESARSCGESLELKREAFMFLEEKVVSLENEVSLLKSALEKEQTEKSKLQNSLTIREEKITSLQEEIALLSENVSSESEESKKFESILAKKEEQINNLSTQNEQLLLELNNLKSSAQEVERTLKQEIEQLQAEIIKLTDAHKDEITREKDHYESLIISFQNQIRQERHAYLDTINRLEQRINEIEQSDDQKRNILHQEDLYRTEIEAKNLEIQKLYERISELERKVVDRDSLHNLERQIREIASVLSENKRTQFEAQPLYTPVYSPYHLPSTYQERSSDQQIETLKQEFQKELAMRDQLISLLREERKHGLEENNREYVEEINNLRAKIDELTQQLLNANLSNKEKLDSEEVVNEEDFVIEEHTTQDEASVVFDQEIIEDKVILESTNEEEITELDVLIQQKRTSVRELVNKGKNSDLLDCDLEGDLLVRARQINSMYYVIEQKLNQEAKKFDEELILLNEKSNHQLSEINHLQTRLNDLERSFVERTSKLSRDEYEVMKSKLHMELQVRKEELRSIKENDAVRIRSKYLSFLREKESQLLKLASETDNLIDSYQMKKARKEELRRLSVKAKESKQQKFDLVLEEVSEDVKVDLKLLQQELQEKKNEHQRLYQNLIELKKEVDKRNELEQILRKNPVVVDYINSMKTLEYLQADYQAKQNELATLKADVEALDPQEDKNQIFKLKASINDLEIILDDLLTKQEYGHKHLEDLRKNPDVNQYAILAENMVKLNNIVKKHLEKVQSLKEEIHEIEQTINEQKGMLA